MEEGIDIVSEDMKAKTTKLDRLIEVLTMLREDEKEKGYETSELAVFIATPDRDGEKAELLPIVDLLVVENPGTDFVIMCADKSI